MLNQVAKSENIKASTQMAIVVYEKIESHLRGINYSREEKERLVVLKDIYKVALKKEPPVLWNLDEKDQPTHRIKSADITIYIQQRRQDKNNIGIFHYYIDGILEFAATYLKERGERGLFSRGKPGDVLEQFLTEFIHWGINDLPTCQANTETVTQLQQRINYLNRILKAENLFKFGTIARDKNKTETITHLKSTLEECLHYAEQEAERLTARDKLITLKLEVERLLLGSINSLYYMRATPVQSEPLRLGYFVQPHLTMGHLEQLYRSLHTTHSGAMLREIIYLTGLDRFGAYAEDKNGAEVKITNDYFTPQREPKEFNIETRKIDLPPWISQIRAPQLILQLQNIGIAILRVAKLKNLIETAYDLTGRAGDLWAYGDEQGKLSLEALLQLIEVEIKNLIHLLRITHTEQDNERRLYNLAHHLDQDKNANPNFNKFDYQFAICSESHAKIAATLDEVTAQMRLFPVDAARRLNEQKNSFYQDIFSYITLYQPKLGERFKKLQILEPIKTVAGNLENNINKVNLKLPLINIGNLIILQLPNVKIATTLTDLLSDTWHVGDDYLDWCQGFMTRQVLIVNRYQTTIEKLTTIKTSDIKLIKSYSENASQDLITLLKILETTRPKWRWQWSFWPVKTAGWPFNRTARHFYNELHTLLNKTFYSLKEYTDLILTSQDPDIKETSAITLLDDKQNEQKQEMNFQTMNKQETTQSRHLIREFIRDINGEFSNPSQVLFERMQIDLKKDRVMQLLALETPSAVIQQTCRDILILLENRYNSTSVSLSAFYRHQITMMRSLLIVFSTNETSDKQSACTACLKEWETYTLYQSSHALITRNRIKTVEQKNYDELSFFPQNN